MNVREFAHTKSIPAEILQTLNFMLYSFYDLILFLGLKERKRTMLLCLYPWTFEELVPSLQG